MVCSDLLDLQAINPRNCSVSFTQIRKKEWGQLRYRKNQRDQTDRIDETGEMDRYAALEAAFSKSS